MWCATGNAHTRGAPPVMPRVCTRVGKNDDLIQSGDLDMSNHGGEGRPCRAWEQQC
jgi:hypothetical protein